MSNSEQPVLDAIDELVDWQLEEGRKREEETDMTEIADSAPCSGSSSPE